MDARAPHAEAGVPPAPVADPLPCGAGTVRLRRLRAADLVPFQVYRNDRQVGRYQGWSPMTEAQALAFLHEAAAATLWLPGQWVQIAIAEAATDRLVGDIGLFVDEHAATAEIGFTLCPAATGRGHATAAVRAALRLLFAHTPVQRVIGITDARNTASARLLQRVGMARIESRQTVFKGEPCTEWVYAVAR